MNFSAHLTAGAVAACAIVSPIAYAQPSVDEIESKVIEIWEEIDSYSADLKFIINNPQTGENTMSGKVAGKRASDDSDMLLSYMEMSGDINASGMQMSVSQTNVFDGEWVYSLQKMEAPFLPAPQVQATKSKSDDQPQLAGEEMFTKLKEDYELTVKPSETVNGQEAWIIEAVPKENQPGMVKMELAVGQETGITIRSLMYAADGSEQMRMELSNIKKNPELEDSMFEFEAPEGVEVVVRP